jgi:hypothetical protein
MMAAIMAISLPKTGDPPMKGILCPGPRAKDTPARAVAHTALLDLPNIQPTNPPVMAAVTSNSAIKRATTSGIPIAMLTTPAGVTLNMGERNSPSSSEGSRMTEIRPANINVLHGLYGRR